VQRLERDRAKLAPTVEEHADIFLEAAKISGQLNEISGDDGRTVH